MIRFADESTITVSSGAGGNGCVAFRREKYVPMGGPAGGDGGRGGDVVFRIKHDMRTLVHLRYKRVFKAKNGQDGQGTQKYGKKGDDCVINIPPGCVIKDAETGSVIYDFADADDGDFVFLKGGNGGWGNCHFKTSTNQAPQTALKGQLGETRQVLVELNIIADIGLVGFPNAGKSSLLDFFTNARPKIAPYPFTTKIPNLGVLHVNEVRDIIIADIPGIIEGASEGIGLGFKFLKHISRTAGLAFLIDLSDDNFLEAYKVLCNELDSYSEVLKNKPRIIIGSKMDLPGTHERLKELQKELPQYKIYGISVFNRWGIGEVKNAMLELADENQKPQKPETLDPYSDNGNFMEAQLDDTHFDGRFSGETDAQDFGATVSLSRKRKKKK